MCISHGDQGGQLQSRCTTVHKHISQHTMVCIHGPRVHSGTVLRTSRMLHARRIAHIHAWTFMSAWNQTVEFNLWFRFICCAWQFKCISRIWFVKNTLCKFEVLFGIGCAWQMKTNWWMQTRWTRWNQVKTKWRPGRERAQVGPTRCLVSTWSTLGSHLECKVDSHGSWPSPPSSSQSLWSSPSSSSSSSPSSSLLLKTRFQMHVMRGICIMWFALSNAFSLNSIEMSSTLYELYMHVTYRPSGGHRCRPGVDQVQITLRTKLKTRQLLGLWLRLQREIHLVNTWSALVVHLCPPIGLHSTCIHKVYLWCQAHLMSPIREIHVMCACIVYVAIHP